MIQYSKRCPLAWANKWRPVMGTKQHTGVALAPFVLPDQRAYFPKQSLRCRGSNGVDKGALKSFSTRARCRGAESLVIYSTW